jgi:hypothetical protein
MMGTMCTVCTWYLAAGKGVEGSCSCGIDSRAEGCVHDERQLEGLHARVLQADIQRLLQQHHRGTRVSNFALCTTTNVAQWHHFGRICSKSLSIRWHATSSVATQSFPESAKLQRCRCASPADRHTGSRWPRTLVTPQPKPPAPGTATPTQTHAGPACMHGKHTSQAQLPFVLSLHRVMCL